MRKKTLLKAKSLFIFLVGIYLLVGVIVFVSIVYYKEYTLGILFYLSLFPIGKAMCKINIRISKIREHEPIRQLLMPE